MAEFENSTRTPVIKIGTTEAVKNVKDLRDNIKGLRDEIVALSNSEEKNEETTKAIADAEGRLIQSQQELNRVMGLTKKGADGVEGSYNNLKAQLRETKQEMDALPKLINGQLNPAWDALAQRYKELNAAAKDYDFSLGNFQRNVGNYGNAWESLGKSMSEVKQVGGDMQNGIASLSGLLGLAGIATDGLDDGMNSLRLTLGLVQGAKGVLGLLKSLVKFVTGQKAATTATKADTTAQKAEAAALTETAAAETAAAAAGTVLRTVLMTLGIGLIVAAIGALVANIESVVEWFVKLGEKLGIVKKQTEDYKDANEKLNKKFEEQKELLDDQQKILKAQGVSNKELLQGKKKLVEAQIKETEATLENIKARQAQMKADSGWYRFWHGENKKIKQAQEEIDAITESLKALRKESKDIDIDIRVDDITTANEARKKSAEQAKKDAEEALKLAQKIVDEGIRAANKEIQAQETELKKIDREYAEQVDLMNKAVEKTKELTGQTKTLLILENGIEAAEKNRTKAIQDYYQKEYEKKAAESLAKTEKSLQQQYAEAERYETIMKDVLGYDEFRAKKLGEATAVQKKQYDILKATVDMLRGDIELVDLTPYMSMTEEEIRKEVGEPLATAIKLYFQKSKELDEAGLAMAQTMFESFEDSFELEISNENFAAAADIARKFADQFYDKFKEMGLGDEILKYFTEVFDKGLAKAMAESSAPQGFSYIDVLFPKDEIEILKTNVAVAKSELQSLTDQGLKNSEEFYDRQEKLAVMEEQLLKKRLGRFSAFFHELGKYLDSYGKATSNLLGNVADAWEESLKAQGKTNEEAFEGVRKLQIATAVINTAAAVVQALADPTIPSYYVKVANAAAAVAAGTAQVIKIANTKYGSDSGTESAPKLTDRTPQMQYTYGLNPADYAEAAAQTPIKAYVVDKDLAEGLDNYNARENETTF